MRREVMRLFGIIFLFFGVTFLGACGSGLQSAGECAHQYNQWSLTKSATCSVEGVQTRVCQKCGYMETQSIPSLGHTIVIDKAVKASCTTTGLTEGKHCSVCEETIVVQEELPALGHTEVVDAAVEATCVTDGLTEGKHCSVCHEILVAQQTVLAFGHTEVVDAAVEATCVTDGLTEGKHCSVCHEILVAQQTVLAFGHTEVIDAEIPATCVTDGKTEGKHCDICKVVLTEQTTIPAMGHNYDNGTIVKKATCIQEGTKKFTCTVKSCGHSYEKAYSLPTFSATELYNQSVKYVGEIVTYDKNGAEYSLGTGFVISSDGKIVTNYHVIEDACAAKITIDGTTYEIVSVLAYDATIDLAVLRVNGSNMTHANICKNAVSVGETVYAIGSSRGMTNTYSQGIITYADRIVDGVSHVQHDASITNGNSGGPLINVYGEVIGINTWVMTDSQNLNFAVFADELDHLVYGTPLTLSEFYQKECDVYLKMMNYIMENGEYLMDSNCYRLITGTTYSSDYSSKYTRLAYYFVDSNVISLDFAIDDGDNWAYFEIDDAVDGVYYWEYFDEYNEMSGTLYASTYDNNTLLGYSYNNIYYSSTRNSVRELASGMIAVLCSWISSDFYEIGVTAADLHFYCYY